MKAVRSLCAEVWRVFADAPVVSRAAGAGDNAGPEKAYWATGPLRIDKSSALLTANGWYPYRTVREPLSTQHVELLCRSHFPQ